MVDETTVETAVAGNGACGKTKDSLIALALVPVRMVRFIEAFGALPRVFKAGGGDIGFCSSSKLKSSISTVCA